MNDCARATTRSTGAAVAKDVPLVDRRGDGAWVPRKLAVAHALQPLRTECAAEAEDRELPAMPSSHG